MKLLAQVNIPIPQPFQKFMFFGRDRSVPFYSDRLVADFVARAMLFVIIAAGLYFFTKLISAGYGYLTSAGDPGKIQNATKEVTNALIGLILIISSYFIIQIIQVVFGVIIL